MNKFFKIFFLVTIGTLISKCSKSDTPATVPLNDFTEQKIADNTIIETYLKEHQLIVPNSTALDVEFKRVPNLDPDCIWIKNQAIGATYPLLSKTCKSNDITYTIYYIKLQQGGALNLNAQKPCNLDGVWTAYKGRLMDKYVAPVTNPIGVITTPATGGTSKDDEGTVFDSNNSPNSFFDLDQVVRGWAEIFPLFKTGNYVANNDGTTAYTDFGAGVMFLPSGLGYFNGSVGSIPSYSPLIFNFKLFEIRRNDHDGDGIKDFEEDLDGDGFIYTTTTNGALLKANSTFNIDDTDEDGYVNAYDGDDDGDFYLTKSEIKRPAYVASYQLNTNGTFKLDANGNKIPLTYAYDSNGVPVNTGYYSYNGTIDNPLTPYIDESLGVPKGYVLKNNNFQYSSNRLDHTDSNRKRNYLDATVHP
jgi:FKBP-type peptidyl-prolyl cis-trans isomerase FkpA